MQNNGKIRVRVELLMGLAVVILQSCVNPPQRTSGVNPAPARTPSDSAYPDDSGRQSGGGDATGDRGALPPTNVPPVAPPSEKVKVSYWLNPTDNNNCLTIQVAGAAAPVTAPCTGTTRPQEVFVDNLFPSTGTAPFKLSVKVETTEKSQAKFESASDNRGAQAWRWRCISSQDPVSKVNVHTLCYEDGNALAKAFDSSDLFVQVVGPEKVEFGDVLCQKVTSVDLGKCMQK
jgi:hypothetical protein